MRKLRISLLMFLFIALILIVSCDKANNENKKTTENGVKMKIAVIETSRGTIKAELYTEKAPITTKNFIELSNSGFYNGLKFHRVEPGFVAQGGDPKGDGTGGSNRSIPLEIHKDLRHVEGALGMARSQEPDSASSQFYITLAPAHFLDGSYAVFGRVTEGMEVAKKLQIGDKMNKVSIIEV